MGIRMGMHLESIKRMVNLLDMQPFPLKGIQRSHTAHFPVLPMPIPIRNPANRGFVTHTTTTTPIQFPQTHILILQPHPQRLRHTTLPILPREHLQCNSMLIRVVHMSTV
jgi:hypothetical protein